VSYIRNGLDAEYNSLFKKVNGMAEPISSETLYSRLLDTEAHLASQKAQRNQKEQYQLMANTAACGNNSGGKQYTHGGHQGNRGGNHHNNGKGSHLGNPIPATPIKISSVIFVKTRTYCPSLLENI
jgi:hypothetical protein